MTLAGENPCQAALSPVIEGDEFLPIYENPFLLQNPIGLLRLVVCSLRSVFCGLAARITSL